MLQKQYYFISDLHIGGDGELKNCSFADELIEFLVELETDSANSELLIVGDSFGLWELTELDGIEKLDELILTNQNIFDQFKKTGSKVKITIIPGNHDYELACYPEYVERLNEYNIHLEPSVTSIREIAGKQIWIEHGMQQDEFNAMPDFGNPHANPIGYFVTSNIVGTAGKYSKKGRFNWLKDIQSVAPMEEIPNWLFSNYFYKEMSFPLRLLLVPFLSLFTISLIIAFGTVFENWGLLPTSFFKDQELLSRLGFIGSILDLILWINGIIISFLVPLAIPAYFIARDFKKTLNRFGIVPDEMIDLEKESIHIDHAKKIFSENKNVMIYIFGHTHKPFLEKVNDRVIINTGTWLKQLKRIPSILRLFPDVYYPSYCLNYFKISESANKIKIDYKIIPKDLAEELSFLQKLMIIGRTKKNHGQIQSTTII